MKFKIGKCYKHATGDMLHIITEGNTCMYGSCLIGENELGDLVPVGKEEDNAINYIEISKDEFINKFNQHLGN